MNERFIRCSECGMPHEDGLKTCPTTGKPVVRAPRNSGSFKLSVPTPAAPVTAPKAPSKADPPPSGSGLAARKAVDFELLGTLIGGKYRVRDVLGEGGMGTVFEAMHEALGNVVAMKILHPNQVHKRDSVQRFHQEARAAARIGHPNICEVYDVGTLPDGRPYLVMDRLTGHTLAERIQAQGGLPFQEVLDTLTQVLSGLHAAHEKGIIHRDIKPENVFLSQRVGCPPLAKILDFGVSKVMADHAQANNFSDVEVTRTGVVLGTPYYLAPEQARGERALDHRVDLYACGVMLYEALTGRRPFRAANYNALLIAILTSAPKPPQELRHDLPPGFDLVLTKAMARAADDRFQTALEFQAALQPFSQSPLARRSVVPSRPPPRPSSGFPPAPPVLIPSRPPRAPSPSVLPSTSAEDLAAFLESASSDALPPAPPPPPLAVREAAARARHSARPPPAPPDVAPVPPPPPRPSAMPPRPSAVPPRPSLRGPSAPPPPSATEPMAARPSATPPPPRHRPSQNFDDQETEVDLLPKHVHDARRQRAAEPPRRSVPVLGPPLRPPDNSPFVDDSATEIMSGAVRTKLHEPGTKPDTKKPPPRPESHRPPRR